METIKNKIYKGTSKNPVIGKSFSSEAIHLFVWHISQLVVSWLNTWIATLPFTKLRIARDDVFRGAHKYLFLFVCFSSIMGTHGLPSGLPSGLPCHPPHKVAIVTGASRGIGFALVQQLLDRGLHVIAVARNISSLEKLSSQKGKLTLISADLGTFQGQEEIKKQIGEVHVDYLVHNAAVIKPIGDRALTEAAPEDMRKIIEINLVAPILITRLLAPNLKGSRVLMISSTAGDKVKNGLGLYSISKVGLDRLVDSLNLDKPGGILAASVHPGDIDTDMQAELRVPDAKDFSRVESFKERKKFLTTQDVSARYLSWLVLDSSDQYFTSQKHNLYQGNHVNYWNKGQKLDNSYNTIKDMGNTRRN